MTTTSVTLLGGAATALRDDLLQRLLLRRFDLVQVRYDLLARDDRLGLRRTILDAHGGRDCVDLPLVDCCLLCTVRDDVEPVVAQLARQRIAAVLVALPACLSLSSLLGCLDDLPGVCVDTVTTLVDAPLLLALVSGSDLLSDRGLAAAPTDGRSTPELICTQLEQADIIGVAGLDRLSTTRARTTEALLAHLAPLARRVVLGPDGASCDELLADPVPDSLPGRGHRIGERDLLAVLAADLCPPSCGVQTIRWRAEQPLHPVRLQAALPEIVTSCVRGRGVLLVAGRTDRDIRWSSAGTFVTLGDGRAWRGDPASDLLLTGVELPADRIRTLLTSCLATPAELARPFADPFADSLGAAHP